MSDLAAFFVVVLIGIAGFGVGFGVGGAVADSINPGPSEAYQKILIDGNHGYYDPKTGEFTLREIITVSPGEAPFPGV